MSNNKIRKGKKNDRIKVKDIEDLEKSLKTKEWEYDFNVTNLYTFNDLQNRFLDAISDENSYAAIVDGPAGTAKTYLAVLAALKLVAKRKIDNIVYVRSVVESASKSIGALPGEIDEKFAPWAMPLYDKLGELVSPAVVKNLVSTNVIRCIPVNFLRGLTFRNSFVIVDEAQNLTLSELTTILTRFGNNSKYVIAGDSFQADIGKASGFNKILTTFSAPDCAEKGIHTFKFSEEEIVRSEILRFIVSKLKGIS